MNDRQLQILLRMVGEVDELAGARVEPLRAGPLRPAFSFRFRHVAYGLAAALLAWLVTPQLAHHETLHETTVAPVSGDVSVSLCYTPSASLAGEPRVDSFQPICEAGCALLAIFREWNADCQCLAWTLHLWENGASVTVLSPGQTTDIPLNVSDDPPVEQVLLLAVANSRESLPSAGERADALLACLNDSALSPWHERDAKAYAHAVEDCLPDGVTVLPQAFVVRDR